MNVIELITLDHRNVEILFSEYDQSQDDANKKVIINKVCKELKAHAHAEEQVVYPHVKELIGIEEEQHAEEEHDLIEEAITTLEHITSDFDVHVTELKNRVTHHVQEEESEILVELQQKLDADTLNKLGNEFTQVKASG